PLTRATRKYYVFGCNGVASVVARSAATRCADLASRPQRRSTVACLHTHTPCTQQPNQCISGE
ncbi:MAG: hypothetical protein P4L10_03420, partial [Acidobacteriaceae bacterium]|nr:hypothetical protein [Acidobacteriaceae bacterium]